MLLTVATVTYTYYVNQTGEYVSGGRRAWRPVHCGARRRPDRRPDL